MKARMSTALPALAAAVFASSTALAQAELVPADGKAYDLAGLAVATSGNVVALGSPLDDDKGTSSGTVNVFRFNGVAWIQEAKLHASDGAAHDRFGYAVALDGDRLVVGARFHDGAAMDTGAAYVYRFTGNSWVQEAELLANDAASFDYFGWSVGIDGDRILVGAFEDDDKGSGAGAAYVFHFDGLQWVQEAKILASDGGVFDHFGTSVSIAGDVALVGAPFDDASGNASGSAYVFRLLGGSWVQEAKIKATDFSSSAQFGISVSTDGTRAMVGAWGDDQHGWDAGAAYVFAASGSTWVQEVKLTSDDNGAGDLFGTSVALRGDDAVVGAPFNDATSIRSGAAYRYKHSGVAWLEEQKLTAATNDSLEGFGYAVDVGDVARVVGVPYDNDLGSESGSAYVFTTVNPLFGDLNGDGHVNAADLAILLGAWGGGGIADLNGDSVVGAADLALLLGAWTG